MPEVMAYAPERVAPWAAAARRLQTIGGKPLTVHTEFKFHPQVYQIGCYWGAGGHTELYLLEGERMAIIDTGVIDTPENYILPALSALGRSPADVSLIINTHGHFDHAGGDARLVAASSAAVWLPEGDVDIAEDLDRQFDLFFAQNDRLVGREDRLEESRANFKKQAEPVKVDRALKEGEELDLGKGIVLRVVRSPGHTIGSVSFYWEREGMLFTGDGVPGAGSRPRGMPLIYYPEDYVQTLDRLEDLDINCLCTGHHYVSLTLTRDSVKFGREGKRFIAESREIAELITAAVAQATLGHPNAPFLETARLALAKISERLPFDPNPETGLPAAGGTAVLHSNWRRCRQS